MPTVKRDNLIITQANFTEVLRGQEAFFTFNLYQNIIGNDVNTSLLDDYVFTLKDLNNQTVKTFSKSLGNVTLGNPITSSFRIHLSGEETVELKSGSLFLTAYIHMGLKRLTFAPFKTGVIYAYGDQLKSGEILTRFTHPTTIYRVQGFDYSGANPKLGEVVLNSALTRSTTKALFNKTDSLGKINAYLETMLLKRFDEDEAKLNLILTNANDTTQYAIYKVTGWARVDLDTDGSSSGSLDGIEVDLEYEGGSSIDGESFSFIVNDEIGLWIESFSDNANTIEVNYTETSYGDVGRIVFRGGFDVRPNVNGGVDVWVPDIPELDEIRVIHGEDGTDGTSGSSGINGTDGTSGSSGVNGTDGTSGSSGINGTDGTSGSSGVSGTDGTSGSSGVNGADGNNGTDGTSGSSGVNGQDGTYLGTDGTSGSSGVNGTDGTSGSSGVNGTDGTSGSSGVNGTDGTSGSSGINGTDGTSGSSGVNGTDGTSGSSGINGTDGTSGSSGINGTDGTSGSSGVNGADGSSYTSRITDYTELHYNKEIYDATVDNKNDLSGVTANTKIILETNLPAIDASVVNFIQPLNAEGWYSQLIPISDSANFCRIEYNVNIKSNATGSENITLKVHDLGTTKDIYVDQTSLAAGANYVFSGEFIKSLSNSDKIVLTIESSANNSALTINQFNFRIASYTTGEVHGGDQWDGFIFERR
jgi:hypothetical protein